MTEKTPKPYEFVRLAIIVGLITLSLVNFSKIFLWTRSSPSEGQMTLPSNLDLNDWDLIQQTQIKPQQNGQQRGIVYRYQSITEPRQNLRLEMRMEPKTEGNVSRLVSLYQQIPPGSLQWKTKTIAKEGTFAIYRYQDQLHLTACLDPKGYSTVTESEFLQKHQAFPELLSRFLPWLIGIQSIYEGDCWWILLSTPIQEEATTDQLKKSVIILIEAWKSLKANVFFQS